NDNKQITSTKNDDSEASDITLESAAYITKFSIKELSGKAKEFFYTGDRALFCVSFETLTSIDEIQVGILVRTVEGVSVFGTSTMYHNNNIMEAKSSEKYCVTFNVKMDLCPGTYFVTFAIARKLPNLEMSYLDRRTDALIFKVIQSDLKSSGIASLDTEVTINNEV
ncbi:ABC transporter ATP-binding protein, partial [Escherichia coli]|nr:ABC transporter ATP-binding protein [Escherichia coli]